MSVRSCSNTKRRVNCRALVKCALKLCCGKRKKGKRIRRNVTIHKSDMFQQPLAGAVFCLQKQCSCRKGHRVVTDAHGRATLKDLSPGTYILCEERAPEGYYPHRRQTRITVTRKGAVKINGRVSSHRSVRIRNDRIRPGFSFRKTTEDGAPLPGAVFELIAPMTQQAALTSTSDGFGRVVFRDIPAGEYVLREVSAPSGYYPSYQTFPVTVHSDGRVTISGIAATAFYGYELANYGPYSGSGNRAVQGTTNTNVSFFSVDPYGDPLAAHYTLADLLTETEIYTASPDAQGRVMFPSVAQGRYLLRQAPIVGSPYPRSMKAFWVTAAADGSLDINGLSSAAFSSFSWRASQPPLNFPEDSINMYVLNTLGDAVPGLTYGLYDPGSMQFASGTSAYDGLLSLSIAGLPDGGYTLRVADNVPQIRPDLDLPNFSVHISNGNVFVDGLPYERFAGYVLFAEDVTPLPELLYFILTDDRGQPIADAEFGLFTPNGNLVETVRTDEYGEIIFDQLPSGVHILSEIGSHRSPLTLILEATPNGGVAINGLPYQWYNGATFIRYRHVDEERFSLYFFKGTMENQPLPGAVFSLFDRQCRSIMSAQSDEDGLVYFFNLPVGHFQLKEYSAPYGYESNFTGYEVRVESDGTVTVDGMPASVFASRAVLNFSRDHCRPFAEQQVLASQAGLSQTDLLPTRQLLPGALVPAATMSAQSLPRRRAGLRHNIGRRRMNRPPMRRGR